MIQIYSPTVKCHSVHGLEFWIRQ